MAIPTQSGDHLVRQVIPAQDQDGAAPDLRQQPVLHEALLLKITLGALPGDLRASPGGMPPDLAPVAAEQGNRSDPGNLGC